MINVEHLRLIQGVINRMAQVSFILKGWAVTIVVAMFGFAANTSTPWLGLLTLFPSLLFGGLDAYYLKQERLFRCLYEKARLDPDGKVIPSFSMNTNPCEGEVGSWWRTLLRPTIGWFYGTIVILTIIIVVLLYVNTGDVGR